MNKTRSGFLLLICFQIVLLGINSSILFQHWPRSKPEALGVNINLTPEPITLSAAVGGTFRFSLFGYTSPKALVDLQAINISEQTYADNTGYFRFTNRFAPYIPREICISAQDQFGRTTNPLCLAPLSTNRNSEIGPIILPPSVSLNNSRYYVGDEVYLSGQTIPNSLVNLSAFSNSRLTGRIDLERLNTAASPRPHGLLSFIKTVEAAALPPVELRSDRYGNFSVALPSSTQDSLRIFARTNWKKNDSAQSNSLNLNILPVWMIFVEILISLFVVIKSRLLEIIIVSQLIILTYYFIRLALLYILHRRNRSIVLYQQFSLIKT